MIGGQVAWDNHWLNGKIDEIRIWNIVRTESEIRQNMNRHLNGNEPGLVAYYRMDEGKGRSSRMFGGRVVIAGWVRHPVKTARIQNGRR